MRFALVAGLLIAAPVMANIDTMTFAANVGGMLGSDEACGISFDQAKVEAYILANTDATDLTAANMIATMIEGNRFRLKSVKPTDLAIHCALAKRSADALGLTQDLP